MQATKLIVVGDPHITAEPELNRGVNPVENLQALVAHVNANHPDAAYCLFIGDLTHNGNSAEYAHFKQLIAPLTVPPILMIGNHDHRENFYAAFPDASKDANGFVQDTFDLGESHRLITLDSLNGPPYGDMRHVGMLSPERLAFLEGVLEDSAEKQLLIAMHHQPFRIGLPGMDVIRLYNSAEYRDLIGRYPNVAMLLMGHNHRSISGVSHGFPFTCFKSMSPQTPLDFESLDPSGGIAEPPSYGVLLLTENGVLVHQEEFTSTATPLTNWDEKDEATKAGWHLLAEHQAGRE